MCCLFQVRKSSRCVWRVFFYIVVFSILLRPLPASKLHFSRCLTKAHSSQPCHKQHVVIYGGDSSWDLTATPLIAFPNGTTWWQDSSSWNSLHETATCYRGSTRLITARAYFGNGSFRSFLYTCRSTLHTQSNKTWDLFTENSMWFILEAVMICGQQNGRFSKTMT